MPQTISQTDDFETVLEKLENRYKIFVTNSKETKTVSYCLEYITQNGHEVPVLYNTNGMNVFHSRSTTVGDDEAITLDERFFNSIAYSYHQVMSFMTQAHPQRQAEKIDETIAMYYENEAGVNQVSDQERWAIHMIVNHLAFETEVLNEFEPIVKYTDMCTEWETPEIKPLNTSTPNDSD